MSEDVTQRPFRKDVLLYALGFLALALLEVGLALSLESYNTTVLQEALPNLPQTILLAFVAGLAASIVLGAGTITLIRDAIVHRIQVAGSLVTRQGFLFQDFGMFLVFAILAGAFTAIRYYCDPVVPVDESHEALSRVSCYAAGKSALVFVTGLGVGVLIWIYFWALRFEKATNSQIMITRHSSKNLLLVWNILIGATVGFVIVLAFYKLFTL